MFMGNAYCSGLILALSVVSCAASAQTRFNIGKPATEQEVKGWDIDVSPSGAGLPAGSGSGAQGGRLYAEKCAACHGAKGEGKPADRLVGGQGTLKAASPVKTIGSFWPYATTIYDYVYRAMPYNAPQSLSANETYALTAYLLHMNGILGADVTLDAASLPKIRMPNRDGFVSDGRPDTFNQPCRSDCK